MKKILALLIVLVLPLSAQAWDSDPNPFPTHFNGAAITDSFNDLYDNAQEKIAGTDNQVLQYNGTALEATNTLDSIGVNLDAIADYQVGSTALFLDTDDTANHGWTASKITSELSGKFDVVAGTDNQILQYNGTVLEATSSLDSIGGINLDAITDYQINSTAMFLDSDTSTSHGWTANKITSELSGKADLSGAAFSGVVTALVSSATYAAAHTLTTTEASGQLTIGTAAMVLTLPTAVSGYSGCFYAGQGVTAIIQLAPAAGDYLVVAGVRGTVATARASAGAAGDKICFVAADTDDWYITSEVGTWSE